MDTKQKQREIELEIQTPRLNRLSLHREHVNINLLNSHSHLL